MGNPKPVWLVKALSEPCFLPSSEHFKHIQIQYYTPTSASRDVQNNYSGWDTKSNFRWKVDSLYGPTWIHTDCILASWRPRKNQSGPVKIPVKQIAFAKDNLLRADEDEQGAP